MLSSKEALEKIVDEIKWTHNDGKTLTRFDKEQVDIIEKELNALEIIKKYSFVFVEKGELKSGKYADIELLLDETDFENQEEYELLKEVLGE